MSQPSTTISTLTTVLKFINLSVKDMVQTIHQIMNSTLKIMKKIKAISRERNSTKMMMYSIRLTVAKDLASDLLEDHGIIKETI